MADYKHFTAITKLITDFQKVTFEQKDFPICLLDEIYTLPHELQGKVQDKKKLMSNIDKSKELFLLQFSSIIYSTYRKGFKPLLSGDQLIQTLLDGLIRD